jgi:hypothetical protein
MWCKRELEDLVCGEAELVHVRGKVWTHAHTESAVGRLGRGTAHGADGVWGGRRVGVVGIIKGECLDIGSGGEERLIPRGVGDGRSQGVRGNDLGHGKGEEATLWREEHYVQFIVCLGEAAAANRWTRNGVGSGDGRGRKSSGGAEICRLTDGPA